MGRFESVNLQGTCNHKEPFIMLEAISRVCTGSISKMADNMKYNQRYYPPAQAMNSMSFIIKDIVRKGHLSILEHIALRLFITGNKDEKCNDQKELIDVIYTVLNNYSVVKVFNTTNNTDVSYDICHNFKADNIEVGEKSITLDINLRTLFEISRYVPFIKDVDYLCQYDKNCMELMSFYQVWAIILNLIMRDYPTFGLFFYRYYRDENMGAINIIKDCYPMMLYYEDCIRFNVTDLIATRSETSLHDQLVQVMNMNNMYKSTQREKRNSISGNMEECIDVMILNPYDSNSFYIPTVYHEDYVVTFAVVAPLPILEQLLRHKSRMALTKLSARYTSFDENMIYVRDYDKFHKGTQTDIRNNIHTMKLIADDSEMINEVARFLFPTGMLSMMIMSKPIRSLIPLIKERSAQAAQLEIRRIAELLESKIFTEGKIIKEGGNV